jgi:hypothetical protein
LYNAGYWHSGSANVFFSVLSIDYFEVFHSVQGHAVTQLVEALRYRPEGRGFDSRWCVSLEFFIDVIVPAAL